MKEWEKCNKLSISHYWHEELVVWYAWLTVVMGEQQQRVSGERLGQVVVCAAVLSGAVGHKHQRPATQFIHPLRVQYTNTSTLHNSSLILSEYTNTRTDVHFQLLPV